MKWILTCSCGIALVSFLPVLPGVAYCWPLPLVCLCSIKFRKLRLLGAFALGLTWGIGYGLLALGAILPQELEGQELFVTGQVSGLPGLTERYQYFNLDLIEARIDENTAVATRLRRIRLNWYNLDNQVAPGETWQFKVKLKRPRGLANPGGFNYETWLFRRGINATGYVRKDVGNRMLKPLPSGHWVDRFRYSVFSQLDEVLQDTRQAPLLGTLMLGQGRQPAAGQWELFTHTGTNHLFVISGLHVGFVALCSYLLVWQLSRLLLLGPPAIAAQHVATIAALIAAACYCAMAGFSLPTQRAFIMLLAILGGRLLRRKMNIWHGYAVALLLVLLLDPLAPQASGFWLSFIAVGGLLLAFGGYTSQKGVFWQWARPQWVVFLVLLPVLALHFSQVSFVAPLANLLAIPLVGFVVVPLVFLGGILLSVYTPAAKLVFEIADWVLGIALAYLELLDQGEWVSHVVQWNTLAALLAFAGALLLLSPAGLPARSLGVIGVLGLLARDPVKLTGQDFRVTVFDVGQGFAALVEAPDHTLIYDTGPQFSERFNAADAVILPFLRRKGITRVDRLIVSHGDLDHAGAVDELLSGIAVESIVTDADLQLEHPLLPCSSSRQWHWGEVQFTLMSAAAGVRDNANNSSCVLRVHNARHAVLLAGDIEVRAELDLAQRYREGLEADVLMAPHHGSLTSSSHVFLNRVQPEHVVISSGYRNRFGHPHPAVVQRYDSRGITRHHTARDGAITLEFVANSLDPIISKYRQQRHRYWLD